MLWMSICVSLHMHLLCVGLRARLRGLCEWMYAVLCVCVRKNSLCFSVRVPQCLIDIAEALWLIGSHGDRINGLRRPTSDLYNTAHSIGSALSLFPASHRFVSTHYGICFLVQVPHWKTPPAKQKPRQWLGTDSFPPCPCSPCLLPFRSEYMCPEPCWAERKQDTGLTKLCTLAWALPQHTLMPLIQETTVNSVTVCLINM